MRLSLVSLVVLSYSISATQLCKELNGSENTSLNNVNSPEDLPCVGSQNSNVMRRSKDSFVGTNVIKKRSSVPDLGFEAAEDDDLSQLSELASDSLKALEDDNADDDVQQNSQDAETGCGEIMQDEMKKKSKRRDMKRSCGAQKSTNIEKSMAECNGGCNKKENTTIASPLPVVNSSNEKVMAECNSGCNKKEDIKKASSPAVIPPVEKPLAECSSCNKKEDVMKEDPMKKEVTKEDPMKKEVTKEDPMKKEVMKDDKPMAECNSGCTKKDDTTKLPPPPVVIPPVEKPMTECSSCIKKEDAKKDEMPMTDKKDDMTKSPPPPVVIPPVDKPMTECSSCNKKEDNKKATPTPVFLPPAEKPMTECTGGCSKKDGAVPPPIAKTPSQPPPNQPPPMSPNPMSTNNTVVIVVENHMMPCSACQAKASGGANLPKTPGPFPTSTPKVEPKLPSPETKSDFKSNIKPEVKPDIKSEFKPEVKPEVNLPKAPVPSSAPPSPSKEKSTLPIFTGDAITASLRSTTLTIVLLCSLFTTLFNLGDNVLFN